MKEQFKTIIHYSIRLVPIVIVVGAITWFFLLRSPGGQTNTSGSTDKDDAPETAMTTTTPETKKEDKVTDESTLAATTDSKSDLPETGPADTLTLFVIVTVAGTLLWEWRLRQTSPKS